MTARLNQRVTVEGKISLSNTHTHSRTHIRTRIHTFVFIFSILCLFFYSCIFLSPLFYERLDRKGVKGHSGTSEDETGIGAILRGGGTRARECPSLPPPFFSFSFSFFHIFVRLQFREMYTTYEERKN